MTTISSSTSTLKTLMALYENENGASGGSTKLTTDQVSTIEGMLSGSTSSTTQSGETLDTLLGTSTSTGSTDLSSILDEIAAKKSAGTATTSNSTSTDTNTTATTPQQKAASLMQSVYQSQQTNLFSLIG